MPLRPNPPSTFNNSKRQSRRPSSNTHATATTTTTSSSTAHSRQPKKVAKLEQYHLPDELPEDDDDELLRQLGLESHQDLMTPPQEQLLTAAAAAATSSRRPSSLSASGAIGRNFGQQPMATFNNFIISEGEKDNNEIDDEAEAQKHDHHHDHAEDNDPLLNSLAAGADHPERDPAEFIQNNNNNMDSFVPPALQVISASFVSEEELNENSNKAGEENKEEAEKTDEPFSDPKPATSGEFQREESLIVPMQRRLTRSNSRIGKSLMDMITPAEDSVPTSPWGFGNATIAFNDAHHNQSANLAADDGAHLVTKKAPIAPPKSPAQPLWPELPPELQNSINFGNDSQKDFMKLFSSATGASPRVDPSAHTAHSFGKSPVEELNEDDDLEMMEEMETLVEGPKVSKTHASEKKPIYYFQQKQILDSQASTLESAAPCLVSAAVRANQSPFSPWCSFHQDLVNTADPEYQEEILRLLEEGVSTSAVDAGSIMATPMGFNAAWRTTGMMIDPRTGNLVLNPAVIVPGAVMTRTDAATNLSVFKAVMIRGIPKFERGVQTTLTSYHETSVWFTICRNALQQMEQIARMSITSERSFAVVHISGMELHERKVAQWNCDLMQKMHAANLSKSKDMSKRNNIYALYLASIREKKGEKEMLQNLLTVPTSDGRTLNDVIEDDQRQVFDDAVHLADEIIKSTTETSMPLLELMKMEEVVRQQEIRSYSAWVGSMEYRSALIQMSYTRRCSTKVKHGLRTSTNVDDQIATVKEFLGR